MKQGFYLTYGYTIMLLYMSLHHLFTYLCLLLILQRLQTYISRNWRNKKSEKIALPLLFIFCLSHKVSSEKWLAMFFFSFSFHFFSQVDLGLINLILPSLKDLTLTNSLTYQIEKEKIEKGKGFGEKFHWNKHLESKNPTTVDTDTKQRRYLFLLQFCFYPINKIIMLTWHFKSYALHMGMPF